MEPMTSEQVEASASRPSFEVLENIPITSLDPSNAVPVNAGISARVALVYPYSSSTETAGILAADPDIRARRNGGQIYIQFKHGAARSIGASGVGIGDVIQLSLSGATWSDERSAVRIPGKSVNGVLSYKSRLNLQISRNGTELITLDVNESKPESQQETPPHSPKMEIDMSVGLPSSQIHAWSSPAILRRKDPSQPSLLGSLSPFVLDLSDAVLDIGDRPKKRTKFWRSSGEWRYSERSPSPEEVVVERREYPVADINDHNAYVQPMSDIMDIDPSPLTATIVENHESSVKSQPMKVPELTDSLSTKVTLDSSSIPPTTSSIDLETHPGNEMADQPSAFITNDKTLKDNSHESPVSPDDMESAPGASTEQRSPPSNAAQLLEFDEETSRPILPQIDTSVDSFSAGAQSSTGPNPLTPSSPRLQPQESDVMQIISPFSGLDPSRSIFQTLSSQEEFGFTPDSQNATQNFLHSFGRTAVQAERMTGGRESKALYSAATTLRDFAFDGSFDDMDSTTEEASISTHLLPSVTDYPDFGLDGASMSRPARATSTDDAEYDDGPKEDGEGLKLSTEGTLAGSGTAPQLSPPPEIVEVVVAEPAPENESERQEKQGSWDSSQSYHDAPQTRDALEVLAARDLSSAGSQDAEQQAVSPTVHFLDRVRVPPLISTSPDRDQCPSTQDICNSSLNDVSFTGLPMDSPLTADQVDMHTSQSLVDRVMESLQNPEMPVALSIDQDRQFEMDTLNYLEDNTALVAESNAMDYANAIKELQSRASFDLTRDANDSKSQFESETAISATEAFIDPLLLQESSSLGQINTATNIHSPPASSLTVDSSHSSSLSTTGVTEDGRNKIPILDERVADQTVYQQDLSAVGDPLLHSSVEIAITMDDPADSDIPLSAEVQSVGNRIDISNLNSDKHPNEISMIDIQSSEPESTYSSWLLSSGAEAEHPPPSAENTRVVHMEDVEMTGTPGTPEMVDDGTVLERAESTGAPDAHLSTMDPDTTMENDESIAGDQIGAKVKGIHFPEATATTTTSSMEPRTAHSHASTTPFSSLEVSQGLMETLPVVTTGFQFQQERASSPLQADEIIDDHVQEETPIYLTSMTNESSIVPEEVQAVDETEATNQKLDDPLPGTSGENHSTIVNPQSASYGLLPPTIESTTIKVRTRKSSVPTALSAWFETRADDTSSIDVPETVVDQILHAPQPAQVEASAQQAAPPTTRPRRRSARLRKSNVPAVLSEWFESRDDVFEPITQEDTSDTETVATVISPRKLQDKANVAVDVQESVEPAVVQAQTSTAAVTAKDEAGPSQDGDIEGLCNLRTPLSYYHALHGLSQLLNSAPSSTENVVDIMAIVTWQSKKPKKAKAGPKDQFTILHVTQPPKAEESTEVHVFRPNKDILPVADKGDVILLRNFVVKSRTRECYLLSGSSSAWHVWRFQRASEELKQSKKPVWAQSRQGGAVLEESKGAPVEVGPEEQEHARSLRSWYDGLQSQKSHSESTIRPAAKSG